MRATNFLIVIVLLILVSSSFSFGADNSINGRLDGIELISFKGNFDIVEDQILLEWQAHDVDEGSYHMQRSIDGSRFKTIAKISVDTSSTNVTYSFLDNNILVDGYYFYRLKAVSDATNQRYSDPIAFFVFRTPKEPEVELLTDFPNNQFSLDVTGAIGETIAVEMYNRKGQEVSDVSIDVQTSDTGHHVIFNTASLKDKHYIVRLAIGDTIHIEQVKLQS